MTLRPASASASGGAFLKPLALALVLFLAFAGFETFPLILRLGTHISDVTDPLTITWTLAWDTHALLTDPAHLFDANSFYPLRRSLAFGEHALGVLPLFAPTYLLTGNPLIAYNVFVLLTFALSGFALFCLAFYWTRAFWPSVASGVFFGFAPYRFGEMLRPTSLNFVWAPLALIVLDRFLRARRWRDLAAFTALTLLQILSSVYLGYMMSVAVLLYVGYFALVVDRSLLRVSMLWPALVFVGATLAVLVPLHLPYLDAHSHWGFSRGIGLVRYKSPDLLSYLLAPPFMNNLYVSVFNPTLIRDYHQRPLFPGLVPIVLLLIGAGGTVEALSRDRARRLRQVFGLIAVTGVILSLGPYLIAFGPTTRIPLPYLLFYYAVPGWNAMQTPHRFTLLALLGASMLAALGAIRCSSAIGRWLGRSASLAQPLVSLVLIGLFAIELGWKPLPLVAIPSGHQVPPVYRWLATERIGPIIELPFGSRSELRNLEFFYAYFSTSHWLPMVNGSSSFVPPTFDRLKRALTKLPSREGLQYAGALGVKAIVLHSDKLTAEGLRGWSAEETDRAGLTKLATFGPDIVYAVPPVRTSTAIDTTVLLPDWLPRGSPAKLAVFLRVDGPAPWAHPRPYTPSTTLAQWAETRTGSSMTTRDQLELPLVVRGGETATAAPLDLRAPDRPGTYVLQITIPSLGIATQRQTIEVRDSATATSRDAPHALEAAYLFDAATAPKAVTSGEVVTLDIPVVNTGKAVWLAEAKSSRDSVKLEWQWFRDGTRLPIRGKVPLLFDVFPGQRYRFELTVEDLPLEPGTYTLEAGLVGSSAAAFSTSAPVRAVVQIRSR